MGAKKTGGKRQRELQRKQSKLSRPLILIVCEGRITETNYFHDIRISRKFSKDKMKIIGGDESGTDPRNIVKYAKEENKKLWKKNKFDYRSIWCVFDRDEHNYENVRAAFDQAQANKFNVAFSNPCFEIWYLLHYQDQTSHIERDNVASELKKEGRIPEYEKNMKNIYDIIKDRQDIAIKRAENLRKMHAGNGDDATANPSTSVDKLITFLNSIAN